MLFLIPILGYGFVPVSSVSALNQGEVSHITGNENISKVSCIEFRYIFMLSYANIKHKNRTYFSYY